MPKTLLPTPTIILDTETTGLPRHHWARVIELGAVLLGLDGEELGSFQTLIQPPLPLHQDAHRALQVNGIKLAELEEAPSAATVRENFDAWLSSMGHLTFRDEVGCPDTTITAFNLPFDLELLEMTGFEVQSWRLAPDIMAAAHEHMSSENALEWLHWKGDYKWPRLEEAVSFYEVTVGGEAHRADTDARAAAGVMLALAKLGKWP